MRVSKLMQRKLTWARTEAALIEEQDKVLLAAWRRACRGDASIDRGLVSRARVVLLAERSWTLVSIRDMRNRSNQRRNGNARATYDRAVTAFLVYTGRQPEYSWGPSHQQCLAVNGEVDDLVQRLADPS